MELPLTQGKTALIDDSDWLLVSGWKWTYLPNKRSGYAVRQERADGRRRTIYMHRLLMRAEAGQVVDHENGDGLDNRRCNLRLCGVSHNGANRKAPARRVPYRGVYVNPSRRNIPYKAQIKAFRKNWHLGDFMTQEAAARAYDRAALHFFGSFARLNFPDEAAATRALPLASSIERRLLQPMLPMFDDTEPWPEGFEFPDPPLTARCWAEIAYEQAARRANLPIVLAGAGDVCEDIPW